MWGALGTGGSEGALILLACCLKNERSCLKNESCSVGCMRSGGEEGCEGVSRHR